MSNATRFAAALALAGAILAPSSATLAQEGMRQAYLAPVAYDNYYNANSLPDGYGTYAAIGPTVSSDSYAAVGIVAQPSYPQTARWFRPGLRGGDWVSIHGATQ